MARSRKVGRKVFLIDVDTDSDNEMTYAGGGLAFISVRMPQNFLSLRRRSLGHLRSGLRPGLISVSGSSNREADGERGGRGRQREEERGEESQNSRCQSSWGMSSDWRRDRVQQFAPRRGRPCLRVRRRRRRSWQRYWLSQFCNSAGCVWRRSCVL